MTPEMKAFVMLRGIYKEAKKNEVVFKQGQKGKSFFYLLKGSVTIMTKGEEFGNFEIALKSHYDGEMFGEQPALLINEGLEESELQRIKTRNATCICN